MSLSALVDIILLILTDQNAKFSLKYSHMIDTVIGINIIVNYCRNGVPL